MMKKWVKVDENIFGDFGDKEHQYGLKLKAPNNYMIGRFNKEGKRDGLCVYRYPDDSVFFVKHNNGENLYPIVHVIKNGDLVIELGRSKKTNEIYRLLIHTSDGSFLYTLGEAMKGKAINFDGGENYISYGHLGERGYETEKVIASKFIPERPIISSQAPKFPSINDFSKFEWSGDETYSCIENSSSMEDPGVGFIEWEDGVYCVGGWLDNYRDGWQIYQESDPNDFYIFYGHKVSCNGFYIRSLPSGIYIKVIDGDRFEDNSYMLAFENEELSYSEINEKMRLDRCGQGVLFQDLDVIKYVNYKDDKNYETLSTYYRNEEDRPKEEPKDLTEQKALLEKLHQSLNPNSEVIKDEPKKEEAIVEEDAEYKILHLIGQNEVKKEFSRLRAYVLKNDALNSYTNILFSGGPGVGKTTVAKLLTEVLYKYKAIDRNHYFEISAKELYSNFTGDSANRVKAMFEAGQGGVILIDDVHYLDHVNNSGVKEGLNNIANYMRDNRSTCFIFSDTKYNIDELENNNTDILREKIRFRVDFKDYTKEEIKEILLERMSKKGYTISEEGLKLLLEVIFLSKTYGIDVNATVALAILEDIIVAQNVRTASNDDKEIKEEDVRTYINEHDIAFIDSKTGGESDARKKLDELIGLEHIKDTIDDLIAYFNINRGKKVDIHMAFTGNPGTGKTEVARIVGKLLRQEGILPTTKFVEVSRRDLVAEFVGQSAVKTRDVIDRAMGGVLYIDEAYSLAYGGEKDFGREVIAELLKAMEDRRGEFCVILSGYSGEMKKLFDANPGFYSRIKYNLEFKDYNDEELDKIARLFLSREKYNASEEVIAMLVKLVSRERNQANFANVRTLREYLSRIEIKQARRIRALKVEEGVDIRELTMEDVIATFGKDFIEKVRLEKKEREVPKADPNKLRELYKNYKEVPFLEYKDFIREIVIAIRTTGENNGESSGFIISNDGYCATCAHCVDKAETIQVRRRIYHHDKRIDIKYDADLVSIDVPNDVAIIKIRTDNDEEFDFISLDTPEFKLQPLDQIFEMGYPFGWSRFDELTVNEGKIGSYQKGRGSEPDQINLDIQAHGGNSGSLIVDGRTSRVIGLLNGASLSYHGPVVEEINFSRPIKYIWELIERDFKKEEDK